MVTQEQEFYVHTGAARPLQSSKGDVAIKIHGLPTSKQKVKKIRGIFNTA